MACGLEKSVSIVANRLLQLVESSGANVVSSYSTSRYEIAMTLSILSDLNENATNKLLTVCESLDRMASIPTDGSPSDETMEVGVSMTSATLVSQEISQSTASKNAIETACFWVQRLVQRVPMGRCSSILLKLLSILLVGAGHADLETAKKSHQSCMFTAKALVLNEFKDVEAARDAFLGGVVSLMQSLSQYTSWHVRETVMICLNIGLFYENYFAIFKRIICTDENAVQYYLNVFLLFGIVENFFIYT